MSFLLKPSMIENMKNNFMIIEAYTTASSSSSSSPSSSSSNSSHLIGTIKLPLHEFYLKFRDHSHIRHFLTDIHSFGQPLTCINESWLTSLDPFTGLKSGEINVTLAMGSTGQIMNLQKLLFDQARTKVTSDNSSKPNQNQEHYVPICLKDKLMSNG